MADINRPHFEISAAVVKQLGEELVTDEVTALIELVKNSYDADASYANVVVDTRNILQDSDLYFTEANKFNVNPGYIIVEDNGTGMGRREIEEGWLTISFSKKRQQKEAGIVTQKKQRTPLGDKGLGRLSTQRLGHRLEMFTSKEVLPELDQMNLLVEPTIVEQNIEYHVSFDFNDFVETKTLTEVDVKFGEQYKDNPRRGTKLVITGIRNASVWDGEQRDKLVQRIAQLLFPFGDVRPFRVNLTINGMRQDLDTLAEKIRDVALARFSLNFDGHRLEVNGKIRLTKLRGQKAESYDQLLAPDQGAEFFAYVTNPQNRYFVPNIEYIGNNGWFISFQQFQDLHSLGGVLLEKSEIANPGKFRGEIDEFGLRGIDLESVDEVFSQPAEYNKFISTQAGIRIYRDGFGIRPYGFDGDDWLKLSAEQTSGPSFYGMRPKNVIGYISLTAKENGILKEKTDREGFVETPYYLNFLRLIHWAVDQINVGLYHKLRRAYNDFLKLRADQTLGFVPKEVSFEEMRRTYSEAVTIESQVTKLEPRLTTVSQQVQQVVDHVKNEPLFTTDEERRLSPLFDDLNDTLAQVRQLLQQVRNLLPKAKRLGAFADSLQPKIDILEQQFADFFQLASLGLVAEALSHELHMIADSLADKTRSLTVNLRKRQIVDAEIITYTEYVQSAVSTLRKQLSHLAPSLRYVRESKDKIAIKEFFSELQKFYLEERLGRSGISIQILQPFNDFAVKMNKGKLTQVIDNLILNSEYWLKEAKRRGDISDPTITIQSNKPFVTIEDNGLGVDPSVELNLFQPFVTTKPRSVGRGLGLFIAQQLLDTDGCSISLRPERNLHKRRYIFQIDFTGSLDG